MGLLCIQEVLAGVSEDQIEIHQKNVQGAIVEHVGNVVLVQKTLTIDMSLDSLQEIPQMLHTIQTKIQGIKDLIKVKTEIQPIKDMIKVAKLSNSGKEEEKKKFEEKKKLKEHNPEFFSRLIDQLELLEFKLNKMLRGDFEISSFSESPKPWIDEGHVSNRVKRWALFPVAGHIFSTLFGTATESELKDYRDKLQVVTSWAKNEGEVIKTTVEAINNHGRMLNKLNYRMEQNVVDMLDVEKSVHDSKLMNLLALDVQYLFDSSSILMSEFITLLNDILRASKGEVTPTLLPVAQLKGIIRNAMITFNYQPILPMEDIDYYYSLIHSHLFYHSILIYIPFLTNGFSNAFQIKKFPVTFQNQTFTVNIDEDHLVVLSPDKNFISFPQKDVLSQCQSSVNQLFVCPSYLFTMKSTSHIVPLTEAACALALASNMPFHNNCMFTPYNQSEIKVTHASGLYYLFFPRMTSYVSVTCPLVETSLHHVLGAYVLPDYCEVSFPDGKLLSTTTKHFNVTFNFLNVTLTLLNASLPFQPRLLHSNTVENVSELMIDWEKLKLPEIFPTLTETSHLAIYVGIALAIMIVIIILSKCFKKKFQRDWVRKLLTRSSSEPTRIPPVSEAIEMRRAGPSGELQKPIVKNTEKSADSTPANFVEHVASK